MIISWNCPIQLNKLCYYPSKRYHHNKFKKILNILYSNCKSLYHLNWKPNMLTFSNKNINELLENDFRRICLKNDNNIDNPKYLFISLSVNNDNNNDISFDIFDNTTKFKWTIDEQYIIHKDKYLNIIDNKLVLNSNPVKWEITNESKLKNINVGLYISCDLNYNINLTKNSDEALSFYFEKNGIHYVKPEIKLKFDMNNIIGNIDINNIMNINLNNSGINVGILLAAGTSSRFNHELPKQLYIINDRAVIAYSIDALISFVDKLIIITNTNCFNEIKKMINGMDKIIILKNDYDCRLKSIELSLSFINDNFNNINKLIVHDSARPFIKSKHIEQLMNISNNYHYCQYYMKLFNGLYSNETNEMVDRDKYIEICTPIVSDFKLFYSIFNNYIIDKNRITYEHISILDIMKINYKLVEGNYSYLRKITVIDDIYC